MKYGNSNEIQIQKLDTQIIAPDGQMSNEISRRSLNLKACISHLASYLSKMHILPFMGCGVTFYNLHCPMCGFSTLCDGGKITQPNGKKIQNGIQEQKKTKILPDLCHFRSSLADDAADQLVGDRHLVGLLAARGTTMAAQHGKRWNWTSVVLT